MLRCLKNDFFENCVTRKLCYAENCVTRELLRWKTVGLENCYAGKLFRLKTVILKNYVILKTLIEKGFALGCITCKILRWGALL